MIFAVFPVIFGQSSEILSHFNAILRQYSGILSHPKDILNLRYCIRSHSVDILNYFRGFGFILLTLYVNLLGGIPNHYDLDHSSDILNSSIDLIRHLDGFLSHSKPSQCPSYGIWNYLSDNLKSFDDILRRFNDILCHSSDILNHSRNNLNPKCCMRGLPVHILNNFSGFWVILVTL